MIDWKDVTDVEIHGIDTRDYPDFADARLSAGWHKIENRPLGDDEIDYLNLHFSGDVYEAALDIVF